MPFVATNKRAHGQNVAKKAVKSDKHNSASKQGEMKTYRVTLRDRNGYIYTYIIQADGSKSLPVLCESKVTGPNGFSSSLPNIAEAALTGRRLSLPTPNVPEKEGNSKKGLFNSLLQYIRKKTKTPSTSTGAKSGKSKRKPKTMVHRKRQRTVSAMSNLDPIQESPEEDSEEDADSYTHSTGSDVDSVGDNEP